MAGAWFAWAGGEGTEAARRPARYRTAVLAIGDPAFRSAVATGLRELRWQVREAPGAAAMLALLEEEQAAAVVLDSWLPDLDVRECVAALHHMHPAMDILVSDGSEVGALPPRGNHRAELLHVMRQAEEHCGLSCPLEQPAELPDAAAQAMEPKLPAAAEPDALRVQDLAVLPQPSSIVSERCAPLKNEERPGAAGVEDLDEFVGGDPAVLELRRRIRLVACHRTPVLVHGPSGSGKELVAQAMHRLSKRRAQPLVVINCAAIPEALVEAELFGHARGAFTGAQHSRMGRIEAAAGGTLFLDEVGELPLAAQGKLLRFLESGEIQRVGENETVRVDVRVVAATHRKLGAMATEGSFRLDLLHRLSVFLIQTPPLAGRSADLDALIERILEALSRNLGAATGQEQASRQLSHAARQRLHAHTWPGNVRELEHTLERAWILAGDSAVIDAECIEFLEVLA